MKSMSAIQRQSGAVSLFVVIFAILLMSIVTVSFLRIMTNDQGQASGNDLAQSAYDSSQAGIEDAKRALIWYAQSCETAVTPAPSCASFVANLNNCNASIKTAGVVKAGDISSASGTATGEVKVQQSTAVDAAGDSIDKALDQAYTCVTIQLDTDDYIGSLTANQSVLVPLVGTNSFSTATIEWYSRDDLSNTTGTVNTPTPVGAQPLLDTWPTDRPSIMRIQFMQVGSTFKLSDFDTTTPSSESNANTLFLYPATNGFTTATMTDYDTRKSPSGNSIPDSAGTTPLPAKCKTSVASGGYACSITVQLPNPVNGGTANIAYLRLTSLYAASHFSVTLGGAKFKNVQPIVDATGRANDVFRRVQSRIDLYDTAFPYPDAAVDVTGNFCKDFGVTDKPDYIAGSCTP
jgi:Tfp pilus assembly protein PilX